MRRTFLTLGLLIALALPCRAMKHLYVDTDLGNNGNACNGIGADACATLAGAVAKLPADLTADDSYTIHCRGTAADTEIVLIQNITTDATHYVTIQTDPADRHHGVWDETRYHMVRTGTLLTEPSGVLDVRRVSYTRIYGIQIKATATALNYFICGIHLMSSDGAGVNDIVAYNLVWLDTGTWGNGSATIYRDNHAGATFYNNIGILTGTSPDRWDAQGFRMGGAKVYLYNNTIIGIGVAGLQPQGYWNNNPTVLVNNISQGFPVGYSISDEIIGSSNNLSDHADAPGLNPQNGKTLTFVSAGSPNYDYHLAATDVNAINTGISDPGSGLFPDDIDGIVRSGSWDIGADEFVAAGGRRRQLGGLFGVFP